MAVMRLSRVWRQKYALDPSVIGGAFRVNNKPFTVVGIASPNFCGDTLRNNSPDLFLPLATEALVQGDSSLLETGKRALAGFDRPRPAGRRAFVNRSPNAGRA